MRKSDVYPGRYYLMDHSSGLIPVRIEAEVDRRNGYFGRKAMTHTHWRATNLKTGRTIEIKSTARLKRELTQAEAISGDRPDFY